MASLFAAAKRFVSYVTGAAEEEEDEEGSEGSGRGTAAGGASSSAPPPSSSARRRERSSGGSGGGGASSSEAARTKRAHLAEEENKHSRLQPLLVDAPLGTGGVQGSRGLELAQRRDSDGDLAHAFFDAEKLRWKQGGAEAARSSKNVTAGKGGRRPK